MQQEQQNPAPRPPPPARGMAKEHRRTPGHDGQAIRPSTAWSAAGATVLVGTSGRDEPAELARLSAAHLALGGTLLPVPVRPGSAEAVNGEIKRISATDERIHHRL